MTQKIATKNQEKIQRIAYQELLAHIARIVGERDRRLDELTKFIRGIHEPLRKPEEF